ncbi:hypothetical protein FB451DRAFT_1529381 [Mycena latifolia]|nr:hypothetical protein FB451DRAFT_1529381 [Mycena latifolia]
MPAIRHARRDRNPPPARGLALPSLSALLSRSSATSTTSSSTDPANTTANVNEKNAKRSKGFSTDTTPLFLRRSKASRVADDVVQRGHDASRLLGEHELGERGEHDVGGAADRASGEQLFDTVESVRTNKAQCVHQIVRALINLTGDAQGLMASMMAQSIAAMQLLSARAQCDGQVVVPPYSATVRYGDCCATFGNASPNKQPLILDRFRITDFVTGIKKCGRGATDCDNGVYLVYNREGCQDSSKRTAALRSNSTLRTGKRSSPWCRAIASYNVLAEIGGAVIEFITYDEKVGNGVNLVMDRPRFGLVSGF